MALRAAATLLVLSAGACSTGDIPQSAKTEGTTTLSADLPNISTTAVPMGTPLTTLPSDRTVITPVITPPERPGGVSIRATVASTFASARIILLANPVSGFTEVALGESTVYRRSSGARAALGDLAPGSVIEVKGQRGGSATTLLADEVVLF